jgi:hypothetical protein
MTFQIMAEALVASLRSIANDTDMIGLSCDCHGFVVEDIAIDGATEQVRELLEHAAFDHASRNGVQMHRTSTLINGYELGRIADLPPVTDHEDAWRERNPL